MVPGRFSYEKLDFPGLCERWRMMTWRLRQESNLYLALRRRSFYPLNYGGRLRFAAEFSHATQAGLARRPCYQRQDQIMSRAFSLPDWARKVKRCAIR